MGTEELVRDGLPLLGVVVGAVLASALGSRTDANRWRREWLFRQLDRRTEYYGQAVVAVEREYLVVVQCADAVRGRRKPVAHQRVTEADAMWREVLARRVVQAAPQVQNALSAFDHARSEIVEAVNAGDTARMDATQGGFEAALKEVVAALNSEFEAMTPHLARHILPARVRLWRRLRGQPLNYL